ncbi:putative short-chain oxidoreductase [Marasmius fiardii PR-910]|nr:putative short-chain oxidoreductase [Marasmius fiardii PR-910]
MASDPQVGWAVAGPPTFPTQSSMTASNSLVVLITGCSSGIGHSVATEALARSLRVIATARRPGSIDDLRTIGAQTMTLDVTASSEDLVQFAEQAIAVYGQVDVVINNAGYFQYGAMEEVSPEQFRAQFETNLFGTINLTNVFVPHFRARKTGTILNISSQAVFAGFPGSGAYAASKAALDAVSKVWAAELRPFNIRVTAISLGSFRTAVATNMKNQATEIECYREIHKFREIFRENTGKEPGDTQKAASKMLDLVINPSEDLPVRLALGDTALEFLEQDIRAQVRDMEEWGAFGMGTNVDVDA